MINYEGNPDKSIGFLAEREVVSNWETCSAVDREPDRVSGVWVFRGTRVPISALFENLRDGASVDDFLKWFPGVDRSQVEAVLDAEVVQARSAS